MTTTTQDKIAQYLHEAQTMELSLVRTLQAHRAMTPTGPYRTALDRHLRETRGHADRIGRRLREMDRGRGVVGVGYGLAQRLAGQLVSLGKAPLDMVRGGSPEERLLKNAKDECASEAREIATYDALERIARQAGDDATAKVAAENRAEDERMLATLREQLPELTDAVVGAEVEGNGSYDAARTGAAQDARAAGRAVADTAQAAADETRSTARAAAETARDVAKDTVEAARRMTGTLSATQEREEHRSPLLGYDELTVEEIAARLGDLTPAHLRHVATYERTHKDRRGVLEAVERREQEYEREHAAG